ncbi:MAG: dimethylsulfonioproprionate lyase family protein [Mycobacteriales bacterium]
MAEVYESAAIGGELIAAGWHFGEFVRCPGLSGGVYRLAAGEPDPQSAHTEDEVYVVVAGAATLRAGDKEVPVSAGSIAYVPAGEEHTFHTVTEDLLVVVVFGPAEGTGG